MRAKPKAIVTFSIEPMVRVCVQGQSQRGTVLRRDDGLIRDMLNWMLENNILHITRSGMCGDGQYVGFYSATDANRIAEWLKERGAKENIQN